MSNSKLLLWLSCYLTISVPRVVEFITISGGVEVDALWILLSAYRIYLLFSQKLGKSKLVLLLFGDSLLYIVLVTSYNVGAIFMNQFVPERRGVLQLVLTPYGAIMPSVLTSHILLNLRAFTGDGSKAKRTLADVDIATIGFREFEEGASQQRELSQVEIEMDGQSTPGPPLDSVSAVSPTVMVADSLNQTAISQKDEMEPQSVRDSIV